MRTFDWRGLYSEGWQNEIVSEAFSHPAKFSRALIRRIYEHALECGWLAEGDAVLDPFAGVALGGLDAMFHGLHWIGVELEEKFVDLGQGYDCDGKVASESDGKLIGAKCGFMVDHDPHRVEGNIELWNRRYNNGMLPRWGTAILLQGDSRDLLGVLGGARAKACVSSPPYIQSNIGNDDAENELKRLQKKASAGQLKGEHLRLALQGRLSPHEQAAQAGYGSNPANLGNMREGDFAAAVVSSPPFAGGCAHTGGDDPKPEHVEGGELRFVEYGRSAGQLGAIREGDVDAVISSPPAGQAQSGGTGFWEGLEQRHGRRFSERVREGSQGYRKDQMGDSPGQLAALPEGEPPQAIVSSPPYEGSLDHAPGNKLWDYSQGTPGNLKQTAYSNTDDNLGNTTGDTFWSAARQIVRQCWLALAPGGVAIFVLKAFVRNKAIVDFPDQWRRMCEACGFETLEWIRAWLVEDRGAQWALDGELVKKRVEWKSFFKRLHEKKYPELSIDYEVVLVMRKAGTI